MRYIAVVGSSDCSNEFATIAEEVGSLLASLDCVVICGGGSGIMEAVSRGASENGGTVIGILPGNNNNSGNRYLTYAIATGLGEARNTIITRTADGVIAIEGEYGTLSEIALALKMGKPVVGLKTWAIKDYCGRNGEIYYCDNPKNAVDKIIELISKIS